MITIRNWNDLDQFGIDVLTGEACAYGYRLLADLTERGKRIVEAVFGGQFTVDILRTEKQGALEKEVIISGTVKETLATAMGYVQGVVHQLATDSDLEQVTGREKYELLKARGDEVVARLEPLVFGPAVEVTLKPQVCLPPNWNSKGVASIMLPPALFEPLAVFSLLDAGCPFVYVLYEERGDGFTRTGSIVGLQESDKLDEFMAELRHVNYRQIRNPGYARNRHVMSGRTE